MEPMVVQAAVAAVEKVTADQQQAQAAPAALFFTTRSNYENQ
jgi:hypothetical protein